MAAAVASPASRSSFDSFASSERTRRQFTRFKKDACPSTVWVDLNNDLPTALDKRFVDVKKRLVTPDKHAAVQASWDRLQIALKDKANEIVETGPNVWMESSSDVESKSLTVAVRANGGFLLDQRQW